MKIVFVKEMWDHTAYFCNYHFFEQPEVELKEQRKKLKELGCIEPHVIQVRDKYPRVSANLTAGSIFDFSGGFFGIPDILIIVHDLELKIFAPIELLDKSFKWMHQPFMELLKVLLRSFMS